MVRIPEATNVHTPPDATTEAALRSSKVVLRDAYKALADTNHLVKARDKKQNGR